MKKLVIAICLSALAFGMAPADAAPLRTIQSGKMTFKAPLPCTVACAYWMGEANGIVPGVSFQACTSPFPAGSFADKVLRAPRRATLLTITATPQVDWDLFICAKPRKGNNGKQLAQAANSADQCQVACVEKVSIPVKPYSYYVIRAYNWSDPADLPARFWFKGR